MGFDEVIQIKNLTKIFKKKVIFENINASIKRGEIVAILGRSGSGKSTLIKTIIGYLKEYQGEIKINGTLGFSTQANSIYESLSTKQNLEYFAKIYSIENKEEIISTVIKLLELEEYSNVLVKKLSGGTKKRVDLACALLNNPDIIILDEPFSGLDSFLVNHISTFLRAIAKRGVTVVFSSHLLDQAASLCDRFFFIEHKTMKEISKDKLKNLYSIT